jgi:hypothetical protein
MESLNFNKGVYSYNVKYFEDKLLIEAFHTHECLFWNVIIDDSYEIHEGQTTSLSIKLTPALIFKFFKDYIELTLDKTVTIDLPDKYKDVDVQLAIVFIFTLPYDSSYCNAKTIFLQPKKISEAERFNLKLIRIKNEIEEAHKIEIKLLSEKIKTLENSIGHDKIKELENSISNAQSECETENISITKTIKTLATKDELQAIRNFIGVLATKAEIALLATKAEISLLANKADISKTLATKDEIKTFATKDEITLLATKAEITLLATKDEIKNFVLKT